LVAVCCLLFLAAPLAAADEQAALTTVAKVDPARQMLPQAARAQVLLEGIVFRYEHIYFEFDSAELLPGAYIALARKVDWLHKHPSARLRIDGHADIRGTGAYNLALGKRRAQAVRDYLVAQGIDPRRIQIASWGAGLPQVPAEGDDAWSWNRRAELRLQ
jgi:peptidoglycan-associated lipoprotein